MAVKPLLYSISYSPWSIRARWALRVRGVEFTKKEYMPLVGEAALRVRLRQARGKVTVPVLFSDGPVLTDSFDIAQFAERTGSGPPLFARGEDHARKWVGVSEELCDGGRQCATHATGRNSDALLASVPQPFRSARPVGLMFGRVGVGFLERKYFAERDEAGALDAMRHGLVRMREGLEADELSDFGSFATFALVTALQFVCPADEIPLDTQVKSVWTRHELLSDFGDVLDWRAAFFAHHSGQPGARQS